MISQLSSPRNTSCWGSRKARPGGCVRYQLVEPQPLFQEAGCWVGMAEKWGVEDLVNGGLISVVVLQVQVAVTKGHTE